MKRVHKFKIGDLVQWEGRSENVYKIASRIRRDTHINGIWHKDHPWYILKDLDGRRVCNICESELFEYSVAQTLNAL